MVRIRLRRMGAKKKPFYRIVVAEKRSPRNGRFIETIGTYDPLTQPETVSLQHDRAAHWLSVGAQPSEAVARLLRSASLLGEDGKPLPYDPEAMMTDAEESSLEDEASTEEQTSAVEESEANESVDATESTSADDAPATEVADGADDEASDEADANSDSETNE